MKSLKRRRLRADRRRSWLTQDWLTVRRRAARVPGNPRLEVGGLNPVPTLATTGTLENEAFELALHARSGEPMTSSDSLVTRATTERRHIRTHFSILRRPSRTSDGGAADASREARATSASWSSVKPSRS